VRRIFLCLRTHKALRFALCPPYVDAVGRKKRCRSEGVELGEHLVSLKWILLLTKRLEAVTGTTQVM
jgi:hypothetical protein